MTGYSLKILIADDDEGDRKQIKRALKQAGLPCECTETVDIAGALAACEKVAFDCAFIDYRLPGQAAQRMDALIDTLHQYTRAQARVTFEPVEMHQVMQDTLSNLEHLIQERGAHVTYGDLPVVTGNAAQLMQLMQNLISNASKYCKSEISTVHVAASPKEGAWRLSVTDNGIGIAEQHYHKIFEPFKRLHSVSKYEGTGLGLATCKKIVERHGGDIWCESAKGQGTTFLFTLQRV